MASISLRQALRSHTQHLHTQLDHVVGSFDSMASYRSFLVNSYRFRRVAEPLLAGCSNWPVQELTDLICRDLDDLRVHQASSPTLLSVPGTLPAQIGAAYVLEGSAIGARLLFARAQRLGMSEQFGARHLAAQAGDAARWKRFLAVLETAQVDRAAALRSADIMFELALSIYSEPLCASV